MREKPADERRHQRALRRGEGLAPDLMPDEARRRIDRRLVEHLDGESDHQGSRDHADEQSDLLRARRRSDEESGLEVLAGRPGVRRRDRHHPADAENHRLVHVPRPSQADEEKRGGEQRRDRHSGDGIRAGADEADDARRHGHEEEPEHDDEEAEEDPPTERAGEERQEGHDRDQRQDASDDHTDGQVLVGARLPAGVRPAADARDAPLERGDDGRQRAEQGDESSRRDRARADLAHVRAVDGLVERGKRVSARVPPVHAGPRDVGHVSELHQLPGDGVGRHERRDQRDESEPAEHAACDEHSRDARADDVSHAHVLGRDRRVQGRRREDAARRARDVSGDLRDDVEDLLQRRVDAREREPEISGARHFATALAGDEHLRARGALGVGQVTVLLHDERAPERDHHQDSEAAPQKGQREDGPIGEVEGADALPRRRIGGEEEEPGQGEDDARGDALAGGPDRLHDVVLEDGRAAQLLEQRDGQDGDRNRGGDRQPGA